MSVDVQSWQRCAPKTCATKGGLTKSRFEVPECFLRSTLLKLSEFENHVELSFHLTILR